MLYLRIVDLLYQIYVLQFAHNTEYNTKTLPLQLEHLQFLFKNALLSLFISLKIDSSPQSFASPILFHRLLTISSSRVNYCMCHILTFLYFRCTDFSSSHTKPFCIFSQFSIFLDFQALQFYRCYSIFCRKCCNFFFKVPLFHSSIFFFVIICSSFIFFSCFIYTSCMYFLVFHFL